MALTLVLIVIVSPYFYSPEAERYLEKSDRGMSLKRCEKLYCSRQSCKNKDTQ
jgi:hypothetical protein